MKVTMTMAVTEPPPIITAAKIDLIFKQDSSLSAMRITSKTGRYSYSSNILEITLESPEKLKEQSGSGIPL